MASTPTVVSTLVVEAPRSDAVALRLYTYRSVAVSQTVIVNRDPRIGDLARFLSTRLILLLATRVVTAVRFALEET